MIPPARNRPALRATSSRASTKHDHARPDLAAMLRELQPGDPGTPAASVTRAREERGSSAWAQGGYRRGGRDALAILRGRPPRFNPDFTGGRGVPGLGPGWRDDRNVRGAGTRIRGGP